jgi:hypothetical protein
VSAWCCRLVLALIVWACAVGCANDSWTYRARDASRDLPSAEGVDAVARDERRRRTEAARDDVAHEDAALPDAAPDEMATTFDAISPPDGAQDVAAPEVRDASCSDGTSPCEGRCVDLSSDPQHCGTCAARCVRPNATAACTMGECRLVRCQDGWMDCNRVAADGCERDVRSDPANCGGCGLTCSFPEATARCADGRCAIASCARRYLDCDGDAANGCEVDLITDARHCDVCGLACPSGTRCSGGCVSSGAFAGYAVTEPPMDVTWIDACALPGAVHQIPDVDADFARGELPFPVAFWGRINGRYVVSSDGLLGFGLDLTLEGDLPTVAPYRSWGALPARDIPYPAAFVLGADLVTSAAGVCVATAGAAASRRWVVEWPDARFVASGTRPLDAGLPRVSFEAIAYEGSNVLDFLYHGPFDTPTGPTIAAQTAVTVGLVDYRSGSPVRAVPFVGSIGAGTRIRFVPR